jgi:hypothetical protein
MRRTAILLGIGLLFAVPIADAGLHRFSDEAATSALRRIAAASDHVSFRQAAFDPRSGTLRVDDLKVATPSASISIAHLTYAKRSATALLVSAAQAATGEISAENIVIDSTEATYKIPHIDMAGTDLSEEDLKALFDAKSSIAIAARLERISAAKIVIPEASVELKNMPTNGGLVYHGIELENVVKARAAQGMMSGLDATLITPDAGAVEVACGPGRIKDYDIAQNVRITSETAKEAEAPQLLYGSFSIDSCKITFDKTKAVIDIGALSMTEVKGRPPQQSWESAKDLFGTDEQQSDDPELLAKRRAYLTDIYASYEVKAMEVRDMRFSRAEDDRRVTGSITKISFAAFAASKIGEIRADDLNVDANGIKVKLASAALRGINLADIGKLATRRADDLTPPSPALDQFLAEGLDVDIADNKSDSDAHVRFQLAKFDMTGASSGDGVPAHFAFALDHFTIDLKSLNFANVAEVTALGYGRIDLSSRLAMNFDRDKQLLGLEDVSLSGKDMGAVKFSGDFSQVSSDLFSPDQAVAEAAVLSALINRVEIRIENAGLLERIIAAAAKRQGKPVAEIRRTYVEAVSVAVPAMLENGPSAKLIGAALAKFVAAPKNFHLVARAPNGLGASDFALIRQPGALMERLEIDVAANE